MEINNHELDNFCFSLFSITFGTARKNAAVVLFIA